MGKKDKRVDAFIKKAQPFAQPILKHIRALVHDACPEVEENIKWGMPAFEYKGPFVAMASFKAHAVMVFHKFNLLDDPKKILGENAANGGSSMGNLGRLTSIKDLPSDAEIKKFIKQAKKLNDEGIKNPTKPKKAATPLPVPTYFLSELNKNKKAKKVFEAFATSHKNEYIQWITEAKTEVTREKRMTQALEWIAEGKGRNWKYEKKK